MSAIEIQSLRKIYDTPEGEELAVDGIDLSVEMGEFLTIVGPSGCGKTTTLRCVAGLETPTEGAIKINDMDQTDVPPNKRNLAMMFQDIALYPHMTNIQNITYPLKVRGVPKDEREELARRSAEQLDIGDMLDKYPGELSGGQRQRVALARTIVQEPNAFLMDEPLSDLDAKLQIEIRKEIQQVHHRMEKPTVYVTHNQEEAMTMSDRIAVMNDGEIAQIGTPEALYNSPRNRFVAEFIGTPSMNFLDGEVVGGSDGTVEIQLPEGARTFTVDLSAGVAEDDSVLVGIRPEDVRIVERGESGYYRGEILLIERLGKQLQTVLDGPTTEMNVVIPANQDISEGESVQVAFDVEDVFIFDPDTEERLT